VQLVIPLFMHGDYYSVVAKTGAARLPFVHWLHIGRIILRLADIFLCQPHGFPAGTTGALSTIRISK
jgi:hypothetical protein